MQMLAARAGLAFVLLLPGALTVFFAFHAGGYMPGTAALVAAELAMVLGLRLTLARRPLEGLSVPLALAVGAIVALGAWTLGSAGWSHAPGRALLEFDRILLYGLALVLFGTLARTAVRVRWMLYGLALALVLVCGAALMSRLLPDLWPTVSEFKPARLSYPVSYWNTLGVVAAFGIVLCGHLACSLREPPAARVLGAAALPLFIPTLLFTSSRGGTAVAVLGVATYVAVGRPRGLLTAAVATVPAVLLVAMATNPPGVLTSPDLTGPGAIDKGHDIALALLLCMLLAGVSRVVLLPVDKRLQRLRLPVRARLPVVAAAACAAVAGMTLVAAVVRAPDRVSDKYQEFVADDRAVADGSSSRLLATGNNGRLDHWNVALDGYRTHPWRGTGAGTYELAWARARPDELKVDDAHSLYVEVLGELGVPGFAALLCVLVLILGAFAVRARGPDRPMFAALLALGVAWAVHAGIDWDWEMPVATFWLFAFGGAVLASPRRGETTRPGASVARVLGIAACAGAAVLPVQVLVSQRHLDRGVRAFHAGYCRQATEAARRSADTLQMRAEPFEVMGACQVRLGEPARAVTSLNMAIERDPHNWRLHYNLAVARAAAGIDPRAAASTSTRLNPRAELARAAVRRLRGRRPSGWAAAAPRLPLYIR